MYLHWYGTLDSLRFVIVHKSKQDQDLYLNLLEGWTRTHMISSGKTRLPVTIGWPARQTRPRPT